MKSYKTKLLKNNTIASDTIALRLDKPKGFNFIAGQYIDLYLVGQSDLESWESVRTLTISSTPSDDFIEVFYRYRDSEFKKRVNQLGLGIDMAIEGPYGRFVMPTPSQAVALIAGGVGVAPFVSMIKDDLAKDCNRSIYLFYSNHTTEEAAYHLEMKNLATKHPNFHYTPTLTGSVSVEGVERGYIDQVMIEKYISNTSEYIFYICGTPDMVLGLRLMLSHMGISSSQVQTESFDGY